jgi:hypothetical protein
MKNRQWVSLRLPDKSGARTTSWPLLCGKVYWLVTIPADSRQVPVHAKRWVVYGVLGVLISTLAIWNYPTAKTTARWLLWSRDYKSKVLSQPSSSSGDLKHIEWDGWGWAGMNTAVYLV